VEYKILNVYIIITIIHRVTYCRMVIVGGTEGMSRYVDAWTSGAPRTCRRLLAVCVAQKTRQHCRDVGQLLCDIQIATE